MIDPNIYPEIPKARRGVLISRVGKLDGISSWSLPAGYTCPHSVDPKTGEMDVVCRACYAKGGHYRYGMTKANRVFNMKDWEDATFVRRFVATIAGQPFFRWMDSGDIFKPALAKKIYQICKATPETRHWIPTRAYRHPEIKRIVDAIGRLPNVRVRYSSPSLTGEYQQGLHGSVVIPSPVVKTPAGVFVCPAWDNEEVMCAGCRACWSKAVPVIAYIAHGRTCLSILRKAGYAVFHEPMPPKMAKPEESRRHYLRLDGRAGSARRRYPWK